MVDNKDIKEGTEVKEEDEEEVFKNRIEWFRDIHSDQRDFFVSHQNRLNAMRAMDNSKKAVKLRLAELDSVVPPKEPFELVITNKHKEQKIKIQQTDNPRPNSSFGFVSEVAKVEIPPESSKYILKINLDKSKLDTIDRSSIRLFRYEQSIKEWVLVDKSFSPNGEFVQGIINSSGKYVAIGLPIDALLLQTISIIHNSMQWLRVARQCHSLDQAIDQICKMILCNDAFEKIRRVPEFKIKLGTQTLEESKLNELCEKCGKLDLPDGGLPETKLFDSKIAITIPQQILFPAPSFCKKWELVGPEKFSGRIKSLAVHPIFENILYAGAADGGVWKTTNGGDTWFSTMQLELSMAIGAIGIAHSFSQIVYAATGEDAPYAGASYPGVGVYKTRDGGIDWDLLSPIRSDRCTKVLVHPGDPNIVYVAGNRGLHKSIDGGLTWIDVRSDHISDALIDPKSPNTIYAGVWNTGVFKSLDGGTSWSLLSNGIPTGYSSDWIKLAMGLNGANGTSFLISKMGSDSSYLYKSYDGGVAWSQIPGTHQGVSYNEWTSTVAVDPSNQDVLFAAGVALERSSDGGNSFTLIRGLHSDKQALVFDPKNSNVCYLATDGGVYKSDTNGNRWTLKSNGIIATQLYTIGVGQNFPFVIGGSTQDQGVIMRTLLPWGSWVDTGAGNEGGIFVVDPNDSNNIYVTPWDNNLRRSTDAGVTWTTILNGLETVGGVSHLAVKYGDSNVLLCTQSDKVFRSLDQGNNWSLVLTTQGRAKYVVFSSHWNEACFVATDQGRIYRSFKSGESGSWAEPYTDANKPRYGYITSIALWWYNPEILYISYGEYGSPHILRSVDYGQHWINASGVLPTDALPDDPVSEIVFDQWNPEVLYAGTDIGVFRTRDGGDSWEPFDDGMPRIIVTGLGLNRAANALFASTMGRGVFGRIL